jgi:hypothetical protein
VCEASRRRLLKKISARTFQQSAHEISTCGNRLRMNFLNSGKRRKIGGKLAKKFFEKKS